MSIANYTTKIPAERTMAEIQRMLAKAGAQEVQIKYLDGQAEALAFLIEVGGRRVAYRLPANENGMWEALCDDPDIPRNYGTHEQAYRTVWRVVKDWLRAQFALIDAGQATLGEVMLPYAITNDGRTLYQLLDATPGVLALGDGS